MLSLNIICNRSNMSSVLLSVSRSKSYFISYKNTMNLFVRNGPQKGMQYVDGLKIGTSTKLLFVSQCHLLYWLELRMLCLFWPSLWSIQLQCNHCMGKFMHKCLVSGIY